MKAKLKSNKERVVRARKLDTDKLPNERTREEYMINIENRFAQLNEMNINDFWTELKEGLKEVGENTLGFM